MLADPTSVQCIWKCLNVLTRKVFGFEQTYMYEILVTGPLCTSEFAGECHFSANLCKSALDAVADGGFKIWGGHNVIRGCIKCIYKI